MPCAFHGRDLPLMSPNRAVNTEAHRRRSAPWWSLVILVRWASSTWQSSAMPQED